MPGDMVSMKLKRTFVDGIGGVTKDQGEEYPHGLMIHLEREQLSALGISMDSLPEVGDFVMVMGMAEVRNVAKHGGSDMPEIHVGLQITDMAMKPKEEMVEEQKDIEKASKVSKEEVSTADVLFK